MNAVSGGVEPTGRMVVWMQVRPEFLTSCMKVSASGPSPPADELPRPPSPSITIARLYTSVAVAQAGMRSAQAIAAALLAATKERRVRFDIEALLPGNASALR